jgi:AcrR family transcriptional regulator
VTTTEQATLVRGPGRPRDPHVEAAIVEATLELLDEAGFGRLTVEAVAARAGVGKATIYRRWPGKDQLVVHALATVTETRTPQRLPGPLRDDLVVLLDRMLRKHATTVAGRLVNRLVGEAPELMATYREQVLEPRRARLAARLARAVDAGELRDDLMLDDVIDTLVGPVLHAAMTGTAGQPLGRAYVERVVDLVLRGGLLRPGDGSTEAREGGRG